MILHTATLRYKVVLALARLFNRLWIDRLFIEHARVEQDTTSWVRVSWKPPVPEAPPSGFYDPSTDASNYDYQNRSRQTRI